MNKHLKAARGHQTYLDKLRPEYNDCVLAAYRSPTLEPLTYEEQCKLRNWLSTSEYISKAIRDELDLYEKRWDRFKFWKK